jgi:hypothetical protein
MCVDARVLGDLVDPGPEGDRAVRGAHPPQRVEEHLLGDVLSSPVVVHHAADVRGDPALIALVEDLERAVVAAADTRDELVIAAGALGRQPRARHRQYACHLGMVSVPEPPAQAARRLPVNVSA